MSGAANSPLRISVRELRRQRKARLRKARQLRWRHRFRRLARATLAAVLILVGALLYAVFSGGFGLSGLLLTFVAMVIAFVLLAVFPRTRSQKRGRGTALDLQALVDQTQVWLETQRAVLPARTQLVVDLLESRLEELSPCLGTLGQGDPAAYELRKLLGDHVPSLNNSYTSIPAALAHQPNAGSSPAAQLHDGLETVARELENIGNAVASGELDALAIRGRYLESRYSDRGTGNG